MDPEKKRNWICGTSGLLVLAALCICPADLLPEPWDSLLAVVGFFSAFTYCLYL